MLQVLYSVLIIQVLFHSLVRPPCGNSLEHSYIYKFIAPDTNSESDSVEGRKDIVYGPLQAVNAG
jgi:hypothetical protein